MFRFRFRKGYEAPIILPSFVENTGKTPAVTREVTKIDRTSLHRRFSGARLDEPAQPRTWRVARIEPPSIPILLFFETTCLDHSRVVRRIVGRQQHRRMFETVDQQTANVVG